MIHKNILLFFLGFITISNVIFTDEEKKNSLKYTTFSAMVECLKNSNNECLEGFGFIDIFNGKRISLDPNSPDYEKNIFKQVIKKGICGKVCSTSAIWHDKNKQLLIYPNIEDKNNGYHENEASLIVIHNRENNTLYVKKDMPACLLVSVLKGKLELIKKAVNIQLHE
jgi:hypothetical protein